MKKQLATAVLVLTLSAGFVGADNWTPSKRCGKPTTSSWTQKAQAAWNYVRKLI